MRGSPAPAPSRVVLLAATAVALLGAASDGTAQDLTDTRLLHDPGVGGEHVAFVYDDDLWVADRDGSDARRITTHAGVESNPRFSPDGRTLAFTGHYDGNTDVFVVPVGGGAPTRLTWHPGADEVLGFTPDGSAVLFRSQRSVHTNRHHQLFTVSLDGGMPERLVIPSAHMASYSPDGSKIAYTPLSERFREWKNYRGGTQSRIWIYDVDDHSVVEIPKPDGGSNDSEPTWVGEHVYFISDRDEGVFNLFRYDPVTEAVEKVTDHAPYPVLHIASDGETVVYEQAGWLHLFDPSTDTAERMRIGVATDLRAVRPRYVSGPRWIRNLDISPSGARAVVEYRGDIVTVPRKKGDPRRLTASSDSHERSPAWSPDGSRIAYFSDASGEYELVVAAHDGGDLVRTYALGGAGFYEDPKWSPDGEKISFTDNSWSLYVLDVASGEVERIAEEPQYGPFKTLHHAWSPDSRWIAYTLNSDTYFGRVFLHSLETGESTPVTDGLSDAHSPVFDPSGKYLYFFASTDAGPVKQWFAQSNADMEMEGNLYLAVLESGTESPLRPESDEEPGAGGDGTGSGDAAGGDPASEDDDEVRVVVDFEDLDQRIVTIPVGEGFFSHLKAGSEGKLYYLRKEAAGPAGFFTPGSLRMYDLASREETTLLDGGVGAFHLTPDGSKALIRHGPRILIADASRPVDPSESAIPIDEIEVRVDPREEWAQIYDEVWRVNRDYFYDPGMHGADWDAMYERYEVFLPHLTRRSDLNRVLQWLGSEVAVGHHRGGGGDPLESPDRVPGGLLGADYEVADGRYRFARVFGGLNWNPDLRSPLTEPGVEVAEGEYLIAVEGVELTPPENLYARFENTAGEQVEITVGPNPDGSGARTVTVVPVESEGSLRNRAWVEGNIDRVTEATDGRVAYVYVPNTAGAGHEYFKRYFFPQADREAIIVDERYNGGGSVADYYIDLLRRPYIAHWNTRYGDDIKTPIASIQGPKVMIIDETAGSGGDLLPWMFRKFELGTLVGKTTWGGLVGILGFPTLIDGGSWTAPNLAIWTPDGGWVVENVGVPPDIEVEQLPAEVIDGIDPQLERAIEEVMRQLPPTPPVEPEPPAYPNRHGGG